MFKIPDTRDKGAPTLGARKPGEMGPFGPYGGNEETDEQEEP